MVCPIGAAACGVWPKDNDDVVVIGACAPKDRAAVLAGFPNESGAFDGAVLPKAKFVMPAVVTGAKTELSFEIQQLKRTMSNDNKIKYITSTGGCRTESQRYCGRCSRGFCTKW